VSYAEGNVILKPVKVYERDLEGIRAKVKRLGISEKSVEEAIEWARKK
jgi:hypothetical protein